MKKVNVIVVIVCSACLIMLFMRGGSSLAMAQGGTRLTAEQAIAAARRNAKPGSSFSVLWEVVANADTRRIADQGLEEAKARKIELLEDGLLANILRSGGFLLAETDPRTNYVIAQHLVFLEPGGAPRDLATKSPSVVKLSDAEQLVKNTAELVEQLYSTPSTEDSSLASKFYGSSFHKADELQGSLFAPPNSLRKLGISPNDVQEAAALYGGYLFWASRYAVSMPVFAASPVAALRAAGDKEVMLTKEFLQSSHMDPNFHLDLDNVQSESQLQERIELLTRLDKSLDDTLKKEADPTIVRANLSIAAMPLGVDVYLSRDEEQYSSSTPSLLIFVWHRLATGGFAIKTITGGE